MCGLDEPRTSVSEVMRDDKEHCKTACPHLAQRPTVQQKVKNKQPMTQGGEWHRQGALNVTEFMTNQPYTQVELVDLAVE